jgi:hypothetical protein
MCRACAIIICSLLTASLTAQTPQDRYRSAKTSFSAHTDGFLTDDSPAALTSTQQLWSAIADFIIERRTRDPKLSAATIDHDLCLLTAKPMPPEAVQMSAEEQCQPDYDRRHIVLDLGQSLLLVAPFTGEIGTVFLIGPRDGNLAVLWSIADASPQPHDTQDLVGAWKPDRAGMACRADGSPHKPGACGPLYASLGLLPPDSDKNPRFYVDAGYSQQIGSTIGKQTSIWTWKQGHAELLWSDWYDFMIDQSRGTDFHDDGILSVVSKASFRSFFSCGMCEERQMERDILVEPTRIRDLGSHSLVPELDLIDTLFFRIAHGQSTTGIAAPKIAAMLRPQLADARKESRKIDSTWFSTGMLGSTLVTHSNKGAKVCFESDHIGQFRFRFRKTLSGGYYITEAKQSAGKYTDCAEPAWLPLPQTDSKPPSAVPKND